MSMSFPKCNQAGIEFVISTNGELQEESKFLSEEFPIAMYTQNFNHAASDSIPFHWHDELQITWISDGELGDETCHIQDVCGILIQPADGNFYGSQWDNGEIHKEEIEMQAAEEPSLQTEEVPMHHIFPEQISMEKGIQERSTQEKGTGEKEASIWEHWENLKQKMTILHPFEGENITCVHMELQDLRELPQKYWCLGNNSFLLHGFFNYRYLFFGEQVTPEGRELFLAVPGVYQKPEKVMAAIFGFPQFRTEKPCRQLEGTFGYWYRRMDE